MSPGNLLLWFIVLLVVVALIFLVLVPLLRGESADSALQTLAMLRS